MGKKVFLYGKVFYEFHKNIVRIVDPTRIFEVLKENININNTNDQEYNLDFIAAYYLSTKEGKINLMLKNKDALDMADKIYKKIK